MIRIAEALEVYDFPRTQETNYVIYVGVIRESEDVIISYPRFLFGGEVFRQIGDKVALDLHGSGGPRKTGSGGRIHSSGMVDKIGVEAGLPDFVLRQIAGELVHDGSYHFQMSQLVRAGALSVTD